MEAEELEQRAQETATKIVKAAQQLRYPECSCGFVTQGEDKDWVLPGIKTLLLERESC